MTPGPAVLSQIHISASPVAYLLLQLQRSIMSASWLQSACLLALVAYLCPGADGFSSQHLCGPHLVEALNMVCADKGFYYNPQRDTHPDVASHSERRGIVQECCENPCNMLALERYCN